MNLCGSMLSGVRGMDYRLLVFYAKAEHSLDHAQGLLPSQITLPYAVYSTADVPHHTADYVPYSSHHQLLHERKGKLRCFQSCLLWY
jgi:hypothetical protein